MAEDESVLMALTPSTDEEGKCKICDILMKNAGSHYHCGNCRSVEVTSMYGHWHSMHWPPFGIAKRVPDHFSCDPGACEEAEKP